MATNITRGDIKILMEADTEGVLGDLTNKEDAFFKSGEFLFTMLKLGYSVFDIETMVFISQYTMIKRVLDYIIASGNSEKDFEFLFDNIKGIEDLDIFRRFVFSNLNLKEFIKLENIGFDKIRRILKEFESIPFFKEKISKKEKRVENIKKQATNGMKKCNNMVMKVYKSIRIC